MKIVAGSFLRIIFPLHFLTIFSTYKGWIPRPKYYLPEDVTDFNILSDLFLCIMFADVWNYWWHRCMHVPYFFNRFHRLHHEYTYTFVWVNHAFSDIEVLIFGASVVIPPILLSSHVLTTWLFTIFTIFSTGYQHSGYIFPYMDASAFHDAHHYVVNANFASHFPFMDMIFGTYERNNPQDRDGYSAKRPYRAAFPRMKSFTLGFTALSK